MKVSAFILTEYISFPVSSYLRTLWLHLDLVLYFLSNSFFFFNRVCRVLCLFWSALSSWKDIKALHVFSCELYETIIIQALQEQKKNPTNCWCNRSVIKQRWFGSLGLLRETPGARCVVPLVQLWDRHIWTLTHTLTASLYCSSLRVISSAVLGTYLRKAKGEIPINVSRNSTDWTFLYDRS